MEEMTARTRSSLEENKEKEEKLRAAKKERDKVDLRMAQQTSKITK